LRVTLLSQVFARHMGYLENFLPKYLARLGANVDVIATDLPTYFQLSEKERKEAYAGFADGNDLVPGTVESMQGFRLHVLAHGRALGHMRMVGLKKKLRSIRPDIVQTTHAIGWIPLQAALAKPALGYKLFTGNHYHASVFPLASKRPVPWSKELLRCRVTRTLPGWLVSLLTEKCYAITSDCGDVAVRFFGVPRNKIDICPLGVDTELFRPISNQEERQGRLEMRQRLGFSESDIVCIYTGRLGEDKNPLLLARAVAQLIAGGKPFRGFFVGNGVQAQAIRSQPGCVIHPFVPVNELGNLYRASDIGVWPTQESLSMLDAAACGLPVVANDTMTAPERLEGNGLAYKLNDVRDLVRALLELRDQETRHRLGSYGVQRMARDFSWESVARRRLQDYETALRSTGLRKEKAVSKEVLE
jgi:glycosyltransferase involved in cell wall biosynthesis